MMAIHSLRDKLIGVIGGTRAASIRAPGASTLGLLVNVSDPMSLAGLCHRSVRASGSVDALLDCAGMIRPGHLVCVPAFRGPLAGFMAAWPQMLRLLYPLFDWLSKRGRERFPADLETTTSSRAHAS